MLLVVRTRATWHLMHLLTILFHFFLLGALLNALKYKLPNTTAVPHLHPHRNKGALNVTIALYRMLLK